MTEQQCLTLVGTTGIQDYVFRSNRLKENAGASLLTAEALDYWRRSTRGSWEIIFVGGGNAALIFPRGTWPTSLDNARQHIFEWSRQFLRKAPGLRLVAAHAPFTPGNLEAAYATARERLANIENRAAGTGLLALPVTRTCVSTGLPAEVEEWESSGNWISQEAQSKQVAGDRAHKQLQNDFGDCLPQDLNKFPMELDDLGLVHGNQHIAIVHADGNGIGRIFSNLPQNQGDEAIEQYLYHKSLAICDIAHKAFRGTLQGLSRSLPDLKRHAEFAPEKYFPLRPIVHGGDDLTFVCHGLLGLGLAALYLRTFEQKAKLDTQIAGDGYELTACAGVAIIPASFPFSRGYQIAEQLCASAKFCRKTRGTGSWLDFEIILDASEVSLADRRRRNYMLDNNGNRSLIMRPYNVSADTGQDSWAAFRKRIAELTSSGVPRSAVKELREALWRGEEEDVFNHLKSRGHNLWNIENTWVDGPRQNQKFCTLYDPIEALDFYQEIRDSNAATENRVDI